MGADIIKALAVKELIASKIDINQTSTTGKAITISRNLDSGDTDDVIINIQNYNASDDKGVLTITNASTGSAAVIVNTGTNYTGVYGNEANGVGTNYLQLCNGVTTGGMVINAVRNLTSASTGSPVMTIKQDNSSDDQPTLTLQQDATAAAAINFVASDRGIITGATNSTASVRVSLGGVVYRLALYVDA